MLVVLVLGRLRTVVVLVGVMLGRATVVALAIIMAWLGAIVGVLLVLVVTMRFFGTLHVSVLVDDRHHL
jgi:hypothetical protein